MNYVIVPYNVVDRDAYASLLTACPSATVFHSLDWMRIYELLSGKSSQFLVCAQDGETLAAAMPVTVFEKFGAKAIFSSGFGVYGGPIARSECPPDVIPEMLKRFTAHFLGPRTVLCSVQDFHGVCDILQRKGFRLLRAVTHMMKIPDRYEDLEKGTKSTVKYRVRRAAKAGIEIFRTTTAADFERWQLLCSANYRAHARRPYSYALYRAVAQRIQETDTLRFYVAKLNDRVVGGAVCVFALKQAFYWMSATDPAFPNYGINDAVFHVVFQDAINEDLKQFDFGTSPIGAQGLMRFKEKWGGVERDYAYYHYANSIGRVGTNLTRYGRLSWS